MIFFCILFVLTLILIPNVNLFGYLISSDTWTFFVTFEIIILSSFYGYRQYLHIQREKSQPKFTFGNPLFDQLFQSGMIKKLMQSFKMFTNTSKMLKQFVADLGFIVFLWVVVTSIMETFFNFSNEEHLHADVS